MNLQQFAVHNILARSKESMVSTIYKVILVVVARSHLQDVGSGLPAPLPTMACHLLPAAGGRRAHCQLQLGQLLLAPEGCGTNCHFQPCYFLPAPGGRRAHCQLQPGQLLTAPRGRGAHWEHIASFSLVTF